MTTASLEHGKLVDQALANEEQAYYADGSMALGHGFTVGDVYENTKVREILANGDAAKIHAKEMEKQYVKIMNERRTRKSRARSFRENVGRARGKDKMKLAREKVDEANDLSNLLQYAANAAFGEQNHMPSHRRTTNRSRRRRLGNHANEVIPSRPAEPPLAAQNDDFQRSRKYGQNHYGRAAIPLPRYITDADTALMKAISHKAIYGSHHQIDANLHRFKLRQANLGASTLHSTTGSRRTSPRKRIAQLRKAESDAKTVVFSREVAQQAENFLACSSAKSKYVPPGAQEGSENGSARRIWNALSNKPGILYFWRQTLAENFARNLFSDRLYAQMAAVKSLCTAFSIGIRQKVETESSGTSTNVHATEPLNTKAVDDERESRIHSVVKTPCVLDRLVEFVADVKYSDKLRFEAAGVLASIVNSEKYKNEHIDSVLHAIVDHEVVTDFIKGIDEIVSVAIQYEEESRRKKQMQKRNRLMERYTKVAEVKAAANEAGEHDYVNEKGEYVQAEPKTMQLSYRIVELRKAAKCLAPFLWALKDTKKGGFSPGLITHIRNTSKTEFSLPRRSQNADNSVEIPRQKAEAAIANGLLEQIFDKSQITPHEDVVWLRGTNQGKLAGTYVATRSNGLFGFEQRPGLQIESGMGIPECGNSKWGAMLRESTSGELRGFSYANRGRVYRYVNEAAKLGRAKPTEGVGSQNEPSKSIDGTSIQERRNDAAHSRNLALSKRKLTKSLMRDKRENEIEDIDEIWEI